MTLEPCPPFTPGYPLNEREKMGGKRACNQRRGMVEKKHAIFLEKETDRVWRETSVDIKKDIKAKKERKRKSGM